MNKHFILSVFTILSLLHLSMSIPIPSDIDSIFQVGHQDSPLALRGHEKSKRSTMLLNKLMNAFQKENGLDGFDAENGEGTLPEPMRLPENFKFDPAEFSRAGGGDGKMFWRCYFNAVSCF